jgi:hypothetical protein
MACACVCAIDMCACSAPAQDLPKDAASQIRAVWADTRKNWKHDARLLYLGFERDNVKEGFETEYAFGADSAPGVIYHVTRGPKGANSGLRHPLVQPIIGKLLPEEIAIAGMLTSKVIDPSQAIAIAVKQGMKGNVLKVTLQAWGGPPLEVWRIVPDEDPALDPNDPIMKNYIIDAMSGTFYSDSYFTGNHVNPAEYNRNLAAYTAAVIAEVVEAARGK